MSGYIIILIVAFILAIIGIWIKVKTHRFLFKQTDKIMKKIKYDPKNPSAKQKFYGSLIMLVVLVVLLAIIYLW
jgi:Ca2+/H+ antiporter